MKLRFNRNTTIRDDRDREMFFLLRMAFWLGLVLVLLPREKTPESDKVPQVGASEAVSAATVIGQRAAEGARKVYGIITDKAEKAEKPEKPEKHEKPEKADKPEKKGPGAEKKAPDHTGSIGNVAATEPAVAEAPQETLTSDDLAVEWRAPPTL